MALVLDIGGAVYNEPYDIHNQRLIQDFLLYRSNHNCNKSELDPI